MKRADIFARLFSAGLVVWVCSVVGAPDSCWWCGNRYLLFLKEESVLDDAGRPVWRNECPYLGAVWILYS